MLLEEDIDEPLDETCQEEEAALTQSDKGSDCNQAAPEINGSSDEAEPLETKVSKKKNKKKKSRLIATHSSGEEELVDIVAETKKANDSDDEAFAKRPRGKKTKSSKQNKQKDQTHAKSQIDMEEAQPKEHKKNEDLKKNALERSTKTKAVVADRDGLPDDQSPSLKCAVCNSTFLSKNKLFEHLKTTNHAIYVEKSSISQAESRGKKSKKK